MKEIKKIEVRTLPNGYSLEFDGMKQNLGYMYFNQRTLLEGFMLHIGLEVLGELGTEEMSEFIKAAENWNENGKCVEEIRRLTELTEKQEKCILEKIKSSVRMRKRLLRAIEEIKKIKKTESLADAKTAAVNALQSIGRVKQLSKKEENLIASVCENEDEEEENEDNE